MPFAFQGTGKVFVEDYGVRLVFRLNVPVGDFDEAELWWEKPDNTAAMLADLAGSTGTLYQKSLAEFYYDIQSGELDQPGIYRLQLVLRIGAGPYTFVGRTTTVKLNAKKRYG